MPSDKARAKAPRRRSLVLLLAISVLLPSCRVTNADDQKKQAGEILNTRRPASLRAWREVTIGGFKPADYVTPRTAVVLPPTVTVSSPSRRKTGDSLSIGLKFRSPGDFFYGCAVPITRDGYFLTAAHCLEGGAGATLMVIARDQSLAAVPARVVWKPDRGPKNPDLALIHAPVVPWAVMPLSQERAVKNTPVLINGTGSRVPPSLGFGQSGGRILRVGLSGPEAGKPRWWGFYHTAPLASGDSGGPVINAHGQLLGISTGMDGRWNLLSKPRTLWFYRGSAEMVDPDWLRAAIGQDRSAGRPAAKSEL